MPHPVLIPLGIGAAVLTAAGIGLRVAAVHKQAAAVTPAPGQAAIDAKGVPNAAAISATQANQAALLASGVAQTGTNGVVFVAKTESLPFDPKAGANGPRLDIRPADLVTVDIPTSGLSLPGGVTGNALFKVTRIGPEPDASQPFNTPEPSQPQLAVFGISQDARIPAALGEIPIRRASITGVQPGS